MSEFQRNYKEVSDYKQEEPKKKYDETQLEELYKKARSSDRSIINEMRTNVLIVGTEHYARVSDQKRRDLQRSLKIDLSNERRIRLTLNFIPVIIDDYVDNVISFSPGCTVTPYKSDDIKQIKNAKLSNSVLGAIKQANDWSQTSRDLVEDLFIIGEMWSLTYFDFEKGDTVDYEQVDPNKLPEDFMQDERYIIEQSEYEEGEEPERDPMTGEPLPIVIVKDSKKPIFGGQVCITPLNGDDVFIEEGVKRVSESAFVGTEEAIHKETLRYMIMNDTEFSKEEKKEKLNAIKTDGGDTYTIFNRQNASVEENEDILMLITFYFRPSPEHPNGKIIKMIKGKVLWDLELQKDKNGKPIFPIDHKPCRRISGLARGVSLIRQGRSPQSEINRCISKMAEAQITLGDDKIVTNAGGSMTEGQKLQGIRHVKMEKVFDKLTYIAGRTGEQYFPYLEGCISWLFRSMGLKFDEKDSGQSDIKATIYKSMKHKKRFLRYSKQVEEMFCSISRKALELAKSYAPKETIIQEIGAMEAINFEEFKELGPMDYNIKVEPMTDDIDDTFARYMVVTESLQYAQNVSPGTKAKIMYQYPWVNAEEMFGNELVDDREAENILLALDRGELAPVSKFDNNKEILKKIVQRRRKADWANVKGEPSKIPNPQTGKPLTIEDLYQIQYEQRSQIESKLVEEIRRANAGMIPMGGPLVDVAVYTNEPKKDGSGMKTNRMKLPQDMINWVVDKAGKQEVAIDYVEDIGSQAAQADIMNATQTQGG